MAETTAQDQTIITTNHAPANVEVDTSVRYQAISVYQSPSLT